MEELWGSWVPKAWSFILREGLFFKITPPPPFTESGEFKMEKSKIKSKAASLEVRSENMTVFIVILFHMVTDNIFHSCFSFQMFFFWCCWTSCPLECFTFWYKMHCKLILLEKGYLSRFCQTTYVPSKSIPSAFLSVPFCEKRLDSWTEQVLYK